MKHLLKLVVLIGMIITTFASCKKEQAIADFKASVTYGKTPLTVLFTNQSSNAESYQWDFGDGSTNSEINPTHTFYGVGTFTVTLSAINKNGRDKKSTTINVIAQDKPIADFSFTPTTGTAPCEISFTNKSSGATSYSWDFGNGKTSTSANPKTIYTDGGTYTVTLTAVGNGGTTKITKTISINNRPTRLRVNSIYLMKYPLTRSNGSGWDPSNGPDIFIRIGDASAGTELFTSGTVNDVTSSMLPLRYTNGFPITFNNFSLEFSIAIYDYDTIGSNELMGGFYFTVNNHIPTDGSPYPSTIRLWNSTSETEFILDVDWLP